MAKYDSSGNAKWALSAGGSSDDFSNDISVDGLGGVYVTGFLQSVNASFGNINLSAPNNAVFIAKVNPGALPPTPQFTSNNTSICTGSAITFTDQSTGSPTGWKWSFTNGSPATSTVQNPTVTYNQAGNFAVKLVVTNTTGTDSITKTGYITVTALPDAGMLNALPDTICTGNTSSLSAVGSSGHIIWQSSANGNIFTDVPGADSTSYLSHAQQNTYYRTIATNGSCADTSLPITLVVNSLPVPPTINTRDSIFCSGDSTQVCATGNALTYNWNTGGSGSCTEAKSAGGYWVTVTDANHCSAVSSHQDISVYPVASVSIIRQGDTLSSFGQLKYQWLLNGNPVSNATSPVYLANEQGSYSVEVTDSNGCTARSNPVTVTGINDLEEESVQIYPNPSLMNNVQLSIANGLLGGKLEIYDADGRTVFESKINLLKSKIALDAASGIYYLRISNDKTTVIKKLIKL